MTLRERYGDWALVVGGSTGLGLGMAEEAAKGGMNVALVARRESVLEEAASQLRTTHPIEVRIACADIANPDETVAAVSQMTHDVDVGLFAYNAATRAIAPFLGVPWEAHLAEIMGNCVTPMRLSYELSRGMVERGRGCIVLISSLSAIQGATLTVGYGSTKAFEWILAEGLWAELSGQGVDVVGVLLGATATPSFLSHGGATQPMSPEEIEDDDPVQTLKNRLVNPTPPPAAAAYIFSQLEDGPSVFSDPIDARCAAKLLNLSRRDAVMVMVANMQGRRTVSD